MQQYSKWLDHHFAVHSHSANWHDKSGIYIFARPEAGGWKALYVGQAASFADRLPNHERWEEARRKLATSVHAMCVPSQSERDRIEKLLIQTFQPELNVQLKAFNPAQLGLGLLSSQRLQPTQEVLRLAAGLRGEVRAQGIPQASGLVVFPKRPTAR